MSDIGNFCISSPAVAIHNLLVQQVAISDIGMFYKQNKYNYSLVQKVPMSDIAGPCTEILDIILVQ